MDPHHIVRVEALELTALAEIIQESRELGYRHVERLARDWGDATNRFDRPGEALFVVKDHRGDIVGVGGVNVDPFAGDARTGRVRRVYLAARARRMGLGGELLEVIEHHARSRFDRLVANVNPNAVGFFEHLGYVPTPDAAHWTHEKVSPHAQLQTRST